MLNYQKLWLFTITVISLQSHQIWAKPTAEASAEANPEPDKTNIPKLLLITDDVIPDTVEKNEKKVIRVTPLDLSSIKEDPNVSNMDSIVQSIKPYHGKRQYINMRRPKPRLDINSSDSTSATPINKDFPINTVRKIIKPKHEPKKKQLSFLYNEKNVDGDLISKSMKVHVAPGAYPVYYVAAKTNGRFGKHPLKNFANLREFMKYLQKNKLQNLPALESF